MLICDGAARNCFHTLVSPLRGLTRPVGLRRQVQADRLIGAAVSLIGGGGAVVVQIVMFGVAADDPSSHTMPQDVTR
jgi:hypothetical protein